MNFYYYFVFIALIGIQTISIRAEEAEPVGDNTVDEKSGEESMEETILSTESHYEEPNEEPNEDQTVTVVFEEIDPKDINDNEDESDSITTPFDELITSEYNGLDVKEESVSTSFSCYGRSFGQYADVSKDCRVFHLCYPFYKSDELLYQRITFLCDNDLVFDQKRFICANNSTIDHKCNDSEGFYERTNQEYLIRVFSQSVSPIDEVKGRVETEANPSASPGWFHWFYGNN
ncbi:uncharacterized protein LOC128963018 [Oppia nitens]|uniref:uncharacterized protein LOC128963018 n=1 Tax=Oppia nitens TaxID=1686743 RepID=UPI0023D9B5D4|nr:uncharacterized protein LOC128963018 [Oppia nitens]